MLQNFVEVDRASLYENHTQVEKKMFKHFFSKSVVIKHTKYSYFVSDNNVLFSFSHIDRWMNRNECGYSNVDKNPNNDKDFS